MTQKYTNMCILKSVIWQKHIGKGEIMKINNVFHIIYDILMVCDYYLYWYILIYTLMPIYKYNLYFKEI